MQYLKPKSSFFTALIILATSFFSCKEKNDVVNITGDIALTETTYTKTPDAPVARKVLVEEFTGAKCPNCPDAREQLKAVADANPNRLIIMEMHPSDHPLGHPVAKIAKYNFNVQDVSDIFKSIFRGYFPLGIPTAGIDRVVEGGEILIKRLSWASVLNSRLDTESPIKLTLDNSYDAAKASGIVKVNVSYTKAVNTRNYISIAVIEDNIVDPQEFPNHIDTFYNFKHVFRKSFASAGGTEILGNISTKEPGRVYEGSFKYTIDPSWKPENCRIIVWLHNNDANTKEVLQAEEIHVKNP